MKLFPDNFIFGIFLGLVGLALGFFIVGFGWSWLNNTDIQYWIKTVFIDAPMYRIHVLTGSALLNIIAFFLLYQKGLHGTAKGILGTLILLVLAMAFFWAD
jgi:hypothetical protein